MLRQPANPSFPHRPKSSSPLSLALLAACLLGGFALIGLWSSRGGAAGKRAVCQSNMKHLEFAFAQYCADNDGLFPSGTLVTGPHNRHNAGLGWAREIRTYVAGDQIFRCPADLEPDANKTGEVVSYGYNVNLPAGHARTAMLLAPARTVLLFEVSGVWARLGVPGEGTGERTPHSASGDGTPIYLNDGVIMPRTVLYATGGGGGRPYFCPPPYCAWPPTRHGVDASGIDGANYLLTDGHVRWLGGDQVATGGTARQPTDPESGATYGRAAGTANPDFQVTYSPR